MKTPKIGKAINKKNPKSKYRVYVKFMHGDADAYSTEMIAEFKDDQTNKDGTLTECFELLLRIQKEQPEPSYVNFEELLLTDPGYEQFMLDQWVRDSTSNYGDYADFDGFYVRYFDVNGTEFEVNYE